MTMFFAFTSLEIQMFQYHTVILLYIHVQHFKLNIYCSNVDATLQTDNSIVINMHYHEHLLSIFSALILHSLGNPPAFFPHTVADVV